MDRLAQIHLACGHLTLSGRHRHNNVGNLAKGPHRHLSLIDRRGLISNGYRGSSVDCVTSMKRRGHALRKMTDMTLNMQVMDRDRFSRDDSIGQILVPMKNVRLEANPVYWKTLHKTVTPKDPCGEVMISLNYLANLNKITCVVIKAKDLPPKDLCGTSDPYVKLWLFHGSTKLEKRKTTVKPQCLAPIYNESFSFNVPPRDKVESEVNILVTINHLKKQKHKRSVMDHDMITSNDEIGHCVIGAQASELGARHWKDMIANEEHSITAWHKLSPKW